MTVITRFPPSPTGFFHIGSARTALFNHLFAAHAGGKMVLRFEDTDKERSKPEFEADILDGLRWLKIPFDETTLVRQSERTEIYRGHLSRLIESGKAYEAEAGTVNPDKKVIRFKNPNVSITFSDAVRGDVTFDTTDLKDFVIAKNIDEPLYHLAVVIDDHEMGVTHVIRGEDHISNTPRQILILEALGFTRPVYAHIPLILAPDRSKLSKRHGAVSINEYRKMGFLPEALTNYLALLGWNPGGDHELFDIDALAQAFLLEHVQKGGAIFSLEKLRWFNREYLLRLPESEYATEALAVLKEALHERNIAWDEHRAQKIVPVIRERVNVWQDIRDAATEGEYDFFFIDPIVDASKLPGKSADGATAAQHLAKVHDLLSAADAEIFSDPERLKNTVWDYASETGRGAVLWPLRFALSGKERSPEPFLIASVIGKEAALKRIESARSLLV